jgi:hypothetical protein
MHNESIQNEIAAHWKSVDRFRQAQQEWIDRYAQHFTHALTLTYDERHIMRLENSRNNQRVLSAEHVLSLRRKSFGLFGKYLSRSLFGNSCARSGEKLLLIGCLEGLRAGEHPHYHCALGVPLSRFEALEQKVRHAWKETPFSGTEIRLEKYYSDNWTSYALKNARYSDRASIDWENARIPASLQAHC